MSERPPDDGSDGSFIDPFNEDDAAAIERERRRGEREAKRAAQGRRSEQTMRSLADRVGGLVGDAVARVSHPSEERGAVEPPASPPPATPEPRPTAPAPAATPPARTPEQVASSRPSRTPDPASASTSAAAPPAASPPRPPRPTHPTGGTRPSRPGGGGAKRRRLLTAGAFVLLVIGFIAIAAKALSGGDEPVPAPASAKPIKTISVTVPEGLTLEQTAEVAKEAGLKGSYTDAAEKAIKGFKLRHYDASEAPSLEGFLFPATYELEKGAPASDLVGKQLEAFDQNFGGVNLEQAEKKNLTPYDVLSIASMIEKEVAVAKERPLVAAVIYNRLASGEPLAIDATLRYELDNYDQPLLESELQADTPYNTRITAGLPPTPIASPGLDSIEAAAAPADVDFRYYVIQPGTCNEHFFTADGAEFDAAVARYQDALAAEGGSPTDCG